MGSKSSSSTQQTDYVTTTNENISDVDGVVASDGSVINQLDAGAINEAFDFGSQALDYGSEGLSEVLDFGSEVIADQADQLTNTLASINAANATGAQLTSATQQETIQEVVKYAALAAGIFAVAWAFKRYNK